MYNKTWDEGLEQHMWTYELPAQSSVANVDMTSKKSDKCAASWAAGNGKLSSVWCGITELHMYYLCPFVKKKQNKKNDMLMRICWRYINYM